MSVYDFTEEQIERYSRQILLREIGGEGQAKLLESSALVVGAGGLGSPALLYLAGAGVGRLGVVDSDCVELSNLHRQIAHRHGDLGKGKAISAREAVRGLNPDCVVEAIGDRLTAANVREIVRRFDVVLDGSDNFPTRFLVSDCCKFEGVPLVSAAVVRFDGQLMTALPGEGNPCYRCFLPEPPPVGVTAGCREAGILGPVAGVMGTLQATEAIKVLLGIGAALTHRMLIYDALDGSFQTMKRTRDAACPLCGDRPTITELVDYGPTECRTESRKQR